MPTTVEEVEKLSWGQLLYLAGENADELWYQPHRLAATVPVGTLPSSSSSSQWGLWRAGRRALLAKESGRRRTRDPRAAGRRRAEP